jgi:hypothetical protein
MNGKRLGAEVLIIAVLVVALVGLWWYMGHRAEAERAELEADWQVRVDVAEAAAERWTEALARSEAEAVFRAFAAGVHPLVPGRADALDQAVGGLLELSAVEGVHVVGADGRVLASSDRKVLATGQLDERLSWVYATSDLQVTEGDRSGVLQLAAPIFGPAGPAGFLWLAYDVEQARAESRPAAPPAPAAGEETEAGAG